MHGKIFSYCLPTQHSNFPQKHTTYEIFMFKLSAIRLYKVTNLEHLSSCCVSDHTFKNKNRFSYILCPGGVSSTGKKAQLFAMLEKACGQIEVKHVYVEGEAVIMMTLEICEWSLCSP